MRELTISFWVRQVILMAPNFSSPNSVSTTFSIFSVSPGAIGRSTHGALVLAVPRSRKNTRAVASSPPGLWIHTVVYQLDG